MDSNIALTMHWASLQQKASCSSPSDQQAAAPLAKGDFADRGIRFVTLALGGDQGTDLGCTAIIMPSAHFYSCPSNDRGVSSSDTSRQCYRTPPSSVYQERAP